MRNIKDSPNIFHLYLDDSGSKELDRNDETLGSKWFAMGGILINESEEDVIKLAHKKFTSKWNITYPLHSYEIRNKNKNFVWLSRIEEVEVNEFYKDLTEFIINSNYLSLACVINKEGYNKRYKEKYGKKRWQLIKTAFTIIVERAVKYVKNRGGKLKIFFEMSDKVSDKEIIELYNALKVDGMPFNKNNSEHYSPVEPNQFDEILIDCQKKPKAARLIQLADLILFPICVSKFNPENRSFKELIRNKKLIDCHLSDDDLPYQGIKYSCFD